MEENVIVKSNNTVMVGRLHIQEVFRNKDLDPGAINFNKSKAPTTVDQRKE